MSLIDVVDETFLVVSPRSLAVVFADPARCREFWPDLRLTVYADRGEQGLRWTVQGTLVGTMEVWLEPVLDGTVLHYYLRADPAAGGDPGAVTRRALDRQVRGRQLAAKGLAFALKEELEGERAIGCRP